MPALPKQVVQQQLEVEEMEKQLYAQEAQAEPTTDAQVEQATPEAVTTEPAPVAPENVVELKTDTWEQKYRTLQGMVDSQLPPLHKQNKELVAQVHHLQEQITALQAKPATSPAPERLVTEQDETTFGSDLLDVQRRVAEEAIRKHVSPLQDELKQRDVKIAQLEQSLTKTNGDVTTMSFEQRLNLDVPEFKTVNADPKWIAWLDEADPYTNEPRRAYAEYVYGKGDIGAIKKVVEYFRTSTGQDQQQAQRDQRQAELNRQLSPSRSGSASASPTESARVYTEAEMGRLFDKVGQMYRQGKNEEAAKLETDLSDAYVQGRVRG